MAKIAIVSDVHLKLKKNAEFEARRFQALIQILIVSDVDTIIFNGDLFDAARPTLEEIKLVTESLQLLHRKKIYIIPGNHEAVTKNANTYDYILLPIAVIPTNHILTYDNLTIRLCPWADIHTLKDHKGGNILISHYRSAIEGLFEEEVDTSQFLPNYELVLLGDIHSRYSPHPNVFYTGCPYPIHHTKDLSEKYGYVELDITDDKYSWEYKDLELPKKVRVDLKFEEVKDFKPSALHLYKVNVSGTLDELSTLSSYANVAYVKFITQKPALLAESLVKPDLNFVDTLTANVSLQIQTPQAKIRNILNELQEGD